MFWIKSITIFIVSGHPELHNRGKEFDTETGSFIFCSIVSNLLVSTFNLIGTEWQFYN